MRDALSSQGNGGGRCHRLARANYRRDGGKKRVGDGDVAAVAAGEGGWVGGGT